ncbi:MAG TPA: Maf family protein [Candidatus Limnocylindrales bacterium]|nr:Maf family protein [Candidatus Limnocylindrales bacterium]
MKDLNIILASASPRRQELLRQIGVKFEVIPSYISEDFEITLPPGEAVRILAERKATAVAQIRPEALIIAADTIVYLDGNILGKPDSPEKAAEMLRQLSGRTHQVITGVAFRCVERGIQESLEVTSDVTFGVLSEDLITRYVETGEPLDKAGAYGIQGMGAVLVESIKGSYSNIVGLPLFEVARVLRRYMGSWDYLNTLR